MTPIVIITIVVLAVAAVAYGIWTGLADRGHTNTVLRRRDLPTSKEEAERRTEHGRSVWRRNH